MNPTAQAWWIGGVTCAGKSTVAKTLAQRSGRQVYSTDEHFDHHAEIATKQRHPTTHSYQHDDEWMRWVRALPNEERLEVWLEFFRERFSLILEDLKKMRPAPVIVEGVGLLPEMVLPLVKRSEAAWLIPTRPFFERHYAKRDWVSGEPDDEVWGYYSLNINHVRDGVRKANGLVLEVDGQTGPVHLADALAKHFRSVAFQ
jgi:2-phosphoglycerate kinase